MIKEIKNAAASIRARLLNHAKKEGATFDRILSYYFQERFLYRLSISPYKNKLVLKGGALLLTLDINKGRPTQDIDFLAKMETLDHAKAEKIIREIATIDTEDGVVFQHDAIRSSNIREDGTINAIRVHLEASLDTAKGVLQIDIGYKDSAIPSPMLFQYPTLLDQPAPLLEGYCWETVIAEKFEAMTKLYTVNSRLKDFYDIFYLSRKTDFNGIILQEAITGTFKKRNLAIETAILLFQKEFMNDQKKQMQWQAFLRKTKVATDQDFKTIILLIKDFLNPVVEAITGNTIFKKQWSCKTFEWK